jgi:hypothetical protein
MKSERRHELQHNALAIWVIQTYKTVEPYLKQALIVVAVLVICFSVWNIWHTSSARSVAASWGDIYNATAGGLGGMSSLGELEDVAEKQGSQEVGLVAAVSAGDARLNMGCWQLFSNRAEAAMELDKAETLYTQAISGSREPWLNSRALYGRARTFEALGVVQGAEALTKAVADYEQLVKAWPDSPYATDAARRAAQLKSADGKAFYEKFAAYKPKPPKTKAVGDLPDLPFDSSVLPDDGSKVEFSKQILDLGAGKKDAPKADAKKTDVKPEPAKKAEAPKTEPAKADAPKK